MRPELHLFVLWEKARGEERRILEDLRRELEVVFVQELSFAGDAAAAYEAFYGTHRPVDGRIKVRKCGAGKFLLVVVRDAEPHYGQRWARDDRYYEANERMYDLKTRYREWTGHRHRVHGTTDPGEFARDIFLLTGHTAAEWEVGVPGEIALNIPADAFWLTALEEQSGRLGLADCRILLEGKYINDVFFAGKQGVRDVVVKCSAKCPWSIGNEYRLAQRLFAVVPQVVAEPLGHWESPDGTRALVVTARSAGPTLTELLRTGLAHEQADRFADDFARLADALRATGIVHRDLFADNFLLDSDGHLKTIDWQLAIDRAAYREDPWVERHWKFRYVVFGVNRELGMGRWNDFLAMDRLLTDFPQTERVTALRRRLQAEAPAMGFACPPAGGTRLKLWLYAASLRLQMLLRGRRHRKWAQLERRWRTVRCKWD